MHVSRAHGVHAATAVAVRAPPTRAHTLVFCKHASPEPTRSNTSCLANCKLHTGKLNATHFARGKVRGRSAVWRLG